MKLSEKEVRKLKKGSIIYYSEYSPAEEKTTFDDILVVVGKSEYQGPKFRTLVSKINKPGDEGTADIFEISNGRAYAIPDRDFIIKLIFDAEMRGYEL